jgi:hypothetical protein
LRSARFALVKGPTRNFGEARYQKALADPKLGQVITDKQMQRIDESDERDPREAARIAEQVCEDLRALQAILDGQLNNGSSADPEILSHIAQARSAAERGVELSNRIVEMLRTAEI